MLYYPSSPPSEPPLSPPPSSGRARLAWLIVALTVAALLIFGLGWASGSAYSSSAS